MLVHLSSFLLLFASIYILTGLPQPNFAISFQSQTIYYPMSYNTALCFLFSAIALLLCLFRVKKLLRYFTVCFSFQVLASFGGLLSPKYWILACTPISIHRCYFDNAHLQTSLTSCIFFATAIVALWLLSANELKKKAVYFVSIWSVALIGAGIIFTFGYIVRGNTPYPINFWSYILGVAANTAIAFITLGAGFLALSANLGLRMGLEFRRFIPVLTSVFIAISSLIFWHILLRDESISSLPWSVAAFTLVKEFGFAILVGVVIYSSQRAYLLAKRAKQLSVMAKAILEAVAEGIFVVDTKKRIVGSNRRLLEMWNVPVSLKQETNFDVVHDYVLAQVKNRENFMKALSVASKGNQQVRGEVELVNGNVYEYATFPEMLNGSTIGNVYSFHDITNLKKTERKLLLQATHDPLTGLANRTLLFEHIEKAIAYARRRKYKLGVLFFDLNNFKTVNDTLGHDMGDVLLREVASRLKACTRSEDTLARLGGDEFVLLMVDIKDNEQVLLVAERYFAELSTPFMLGDQELTLACSLGISMYPENGLTPTTLLKHADLAMYHAKKNFQKLEFYQSGLEGKNKSKLELENELYQAIKSDHLFLEYQPIIDAKSMVIVGTEALLRWHNPQRGIVMPDRFIYLAEGSSLIQDLGIWVLRKACEQNKAWQDANLLTAKIHVNVSPAQLRNMDFFVNTYNLLQELSLDPQYLEMELTESMKIDDFHFIESVLNKFKNLGVKFCMDDFGTGYASFKYLKNLPLSKIKIDKSFIDEVTQVDSARSIVLAILAMAKSMNLKVVSEGVEMKEQFEFLKSAGCDEIQGYFVSAPLNAEKYIEFVQRYQKNFENWM